MDSIGLVALLLIGLVPACFVGARIWQDPFAGLCLWVLLLPVTKTCATFLGYPDGQGPEILQKLTLADPVLLATACASVLNRRGAVGILGRQGRRVVLLLGAFCAVGVVSAIVGHAGPEAFIELATYSWLCVSVVVISRLLRDRERADPGYRIGRAVRARRSQSRGPALLPDGSDRAGAEGGLERGV